MAPINAEALQLLDRIDRNLDLRLKLLRITSTLGPAPAETETLIRSVENDVKILVDLLRIAMTPTPVEKSAEERAQQ